MRLKQTTFDYIIIGAGSAGCVLANRLSADDAEVLLIEAGGNDNNPLIHMPAGIAKLIPNKSILWDYHTAAEDNLKQRTLYWPRAHVLGGCSSINAMCYIRGHKDDYADWANDIGTDFWQYKNTLPYFKKAERNQRGASEYHGADGPLGVSDSRHISEITHVFLDAANNQGYASNSDFNGQQQHGVGYYQTTTWDAKRCSTATAYLKPIKQRPNLTILTKAFAEKLLFDNDQCTGVRIQYQGKSIALNASRETIVACGALESPKLLMLSGIGNADELEPLDIALKANLPGVGKNLQDHLDVCTVQRSTLNNTLKLSVLNDIKVGIQYYLTKTGEATTNIAESGGFIHSQYASKERPDIQLHFIPAILDDHGRNKIKGNGYTLHACQLNPKSRGTISLQSKDAQVAPKINANYLSDGHDVNVLLDALHLSRALLADKAFDHTRGVELFPGSSKQSTAELIDFIRAKSETVYHPVGTCKMGADYSKAGKAVVNQFCQVHTLEKLRVVDASVMPIIPAGNTNAPTIMIAEKIAEHILAA